MGKAENEHPARAYGTDKQFLDWLTYQPSCLDGVFNQWQDGVGRNIACHVRRAGFAGTGFKPPFSAVPMTDAQHKVQSGRDGEVGVLLKYTGQAFALEQAKLWFENQVAMYLQQWIHERIRAGITPKRVSVL